MDGYFLRDDDIIGDKPFDLAVEDWKISPTTDFTLGSPELHFATENLLDKEFKVEKSLDDCSSDSWFAVLSTKESWEGAKSKSLDPEERFLSEQVVPDEGQVIHIADQNKKAVPLNEIQTNSIEISKDSYAKKNSCSPVEISTDIRMCSPLEEIRENSDSALLNYDHKGQVKNEQELPPANVMFNFNPLCEEKNDDKTTEKNLNDKISPELNKLTLGESILSPLHATIVKNANLQVTSENGGHSLNELDQHSGNVETNKSIKIKFEENKPEHRDCEIKSKAKEILRMRRRFMKLLTATKIPKCTMVNYKFDSSNKLPSFAETFCPDLSNVQSRKDSSVQLPKALANFEKNKDTDEMFLSFSESDSEGGCSETDQEHDRRKKKELKSLALETLNPAESSRVSVKLEVMENDCEMSNRTQKKHNADTPSSILAIDDELEKFLVSSIVLNDTANNSNSQLPDLSNNIGSILTSDELADEHSMDTVYGNLFLKSELQANDVAETCKEDESLKITDSLSNYEGNVCNTALLGSDRPWQEQLTQENINTLYSNIWPRGIPNEPAFVNQISSRHFTNNMFHMNDPFVNHTDMKAMTVLPTDIMQTEIVEPFKFTNTLTVPKVEVVDSSLNYGL